MDENIKLAWKCVDVLFLFMGEFLSIPYSCVTQIQHSPQSHNGFLQYTVQKWPDNVSVVRWQGFPCETGLLQTNTCRMFQLVGKYMHVCLFVSVWFILFSLIFYREVQETQSKLCGWVFLLNYNQTNNISFRAFYLSGTIKWALMQNISGLKWILMVWG